MVIYLPGITPTLLGVVKDPSTGDKYTVDRLKIIDDQGRISDNGVNPVKVLELAFRTLNPTEKTTLLGIIYAYVGYPLIWEFSGSQYIGIVDTTTLETIRTRECSEDLTIQIFIADSVFATLGSRLTALEAISRTSTATRGRVGNETRTLFISRAGAAFLTRLASRNISTQISRTRSGWLTRLANRNISTQISKNRSGQLSRFGVRTANAPITRTSGGWLTRLGNRNAIINTATWRYNFGVSADVDTQPYGGGTSTDFCTVLSTYKSILVELTGSTGWGWPTFTLTNSTYSSGMRVPGNGWTSNVRGFEAVTSIGQLVFDMNIVSSFAGGGQFVAGAEIKIGGRRLDDVVEQVASIQFYSDAAKNIIASRRIVVNTIGAWNA